jgi:hypothetical protein
LAGTYHEKKEAVMEMSSLQSASKYNVTILDLNYSIDYNQIFTRDIGFVIDGIL